MGYEFDDNGRYVGWSDLFDYSSIETLKASEFLPTPNKVNYYKGEGGFDITSYLNRIVMSPDKASKIMVYAELLNKLGDGKIEEDNLGNKKLRVTWDNTFDEKVANNIIGLLNKHEFTKLSPLMIEAAYKNSVSSNILNIIQDLRNMDAAYSPIEMEGIREASTHSPKGSLASNMTLMNPLTKYSMLVQNMVGKGVIGITAVGEKVFFNNSYYWNEGIRSQDPKWINNMKFSQTFNRIQGRGSGKIVPITKTTIANANFEGFDNIRTEFIHAAEQDAILRAKFGITDTDIESQSENWQQYKKELQDWIKENQDTKTSADLSISELLSAATDNAKELILAKINAGTNLARMYLHLIIMGFSINDIVQFMISPTVSLINDLSEANMFDEYVDQMRVQDAVKILLGQVNPNQFFSGEVKTEEGDTTSNAKIAFSYLSIALKGKLGMDEDKDGNPVPKKYKKFSDLVADFIMAKVRGDSSLGTLRESITKKLSSGMDSNMTALSDYVESIIEKIKAGIDAMEVERLPEDTWKSLYNRKLTEFYADLDEFNKVWNLATETSTLGSGFYGLNQGLPTSKADLMGKLRTLENAVSTREKSFGIELDQIVPLKSDTKKAVKRKQENLINLLSTLQANNPLLDSEYITNVFTTALSINLVNNFNIETWLMDDYVSLPNGDIARYRDIVSDYYNIIKGTWNIFDMIERIPHYNSIFKLLKTVYISDAAVSKKSNIVNLIQRKVIEESGFLDEQGIKNLLRYVDELLITNWLRESDFKFPVFEGEEFFNRYVDRVISPRNSFVDLSTSEGRASFKLLMESVLIPNLKTGFYNDIERVEEDGKEVIKSVRKEIVSNAFIDGLMNNVDNGVPFKKLNIDMMNLNSTPASSIKFQSYLDGLCKLKNYTLNGRPLSDWFMLYNFIVNQNRYGSDRLTTIFKPFIGLIKDNSVIKKYFQNTGELDYSSLKTFEDLEELGFNMRDAFIKMAPFVSRSAERQARPKFIRQSDKLGGIIYKERLKNGSYRAISILPKKTLSGDGNLQVRNQRLKDFQEYWTIQTPTYDSLMNLQTNMSSLNAEELLQALMEYTSRGILKIYKENC